MILLLFRTDELQILMLRLLIHYLSPFFGTLEESVGKPVDISRRKMDETERMWERHN